MLFNWILINKLAIGTPFISEEQKFFLKGKGIISILDLRNKNDFLLIDQEKYVNNTQGFKYKNFQLPDHKSKRFAQKEEIINAVEILDYLITKGPVFMHCHAAAERSPLISIAYLYKTKGLSLIQASDYVKQQNKSTNLHIKQLKSLNLI